MLVFDSKWRFDSPGNIPVEIIHKFDDFISRISRQGNRWDILEHFKTYFSDAAGISSSRSSSESWAESDLSTFMHKAAENAAMFIEAFYDGCEGILRKNPEFGVPDVGMINRVLREAGTDYEIHIPNLLFGTATESVIVQDRHPSLDEQARELIQRSLKASEGLLSEGRNRPAVSEILWLLETISTAFRGMEVAGGTVQEKYFNKIVWELRKHHKGKTLGQVLDWTMTLHGYLSSPTGGGVRHGADIQVATEMQQNEARLFCNLIRSYIGFLIDEHARLNVLQPPHF